jgi:NAD(P)-dependent dehydrogenase (short-subunit alcohol dehydrogenase family)
MDCELRYKQHIAKTATKGLTAVLALRRLKMLSPRTARQLFVATVAPVMDYAASVWMHACGGKALSWLNRAQKIGALAITGAFRTVATAVVEAEASILSIRERHTRAAARLWINIQTLPGTHPLAWKKIRTTARFVSPLQKIARAVEGIKTERIETIQEYALVALKFPNTASPYGGSKTALNWFVRRLHFEEPWLTSFVFHPGLVETDLAAASVAGTGVALKDLGAITVDTSVAGMVKTIDSATRDISGTFQNYDGAVNPW